MTSSRPQLRSNPSNEGRTAGTPWVACALAVAVVVAVLVAGCPTGGSKTRAPVENCEEIGQRCALENGKVGICTMKPDQNFQCVPQH